MNTGPTDHAALLLALTALPADVRRSRIERAGDVDSILLALGDEAEKLVVVEVARAIASAELVRTLADEIGDAAARARARRALGQALAYAGRFTEALSTCEEAIRIADEAGETVQGARARLASIHALGELGRYDEAVRAGETARQMLVRAGQPALAARADLNLGVVLRKCDRPADAVAHFTRARDALADEPAIFAQLESNRGEALLDLDDLDGAEEAFTSALRIFERMSHDWGAAVVEGNLADLATRRGRFDRSLYHFESARRHLEVDQSPTHVARLLVEQADAKQSLGMLEEARHDYAAALPLLERHEQPAEAARARAGLARVLLRLGRLHDAEASLHAAAETYESLG